MRIRWRHLVLVAIIAPLLGLMVAWSGLISVRANTGHWAVTDWFLHWVMRNSVSTASLGTEAPPLDEPAMVQHAAGHFESGCAICHGSPSMARSASVLAMLPPPPDLAKAAGEWTDEQLFEIVKHGVRFTGMPAWPTQGRDDEVWAMVAFLRKLPDMDAEAYSRLAGFHQPTAGAVSPEALTCESCHSDDRLGPDSRIPALSGQSEAYILESLKAYGEGRRASGIMQTAIAALPRESLPELARYFAGKTPMNRPSAQMPVETVEKGRLLAETGRAKDKIPACLSCHEREGGNPVYPKLSGQAQPYLRQQLQLFAQGIRGGTSYSHLMTEAAKNLKDDDIEALAAYFAQRR